MAQKYTPRQMEQIHKERCPGKWSGTMFLDGDNWYANSYHCTKCKATATVSGKRHGKPEYSYTGIIDDDDKEGDSVPTIVDASEVPGATQEQGDARKLADVWGEPLQIEFVTQLDIPAKNGDPARTAYKATCQSLANEESFELWLPDSKGGKFIAFFREHPDTVIQGRWFKDPELAGKPHKGWQFVGLDVIPDDKPNKKLHAMPGTAVAAEMPF